MHPPAAADGPPFCAADASEPKNLNVTLSSRRIYTIVPSSDPSLAGSRARTILSCLCFSAPRVRTFGEPGRADDDRAGREYRFCRLLPSERTSAPFAQPVGCNLPSQRIVSPVIQVGLVGILGAAIR